MSALYNLEPQPTAKVLLTTTSGDLLLELFAKQTPLTSRNFLQHCLDDYYNGTIFHRLVPGFIVQGGDPTNTGHGGEAIYPGGTFEDEFHSRLRFNRRGLLGMANGGEKNDNGSQFFLTLGDTRELEGRHTMFGRVVGDTIYNLMKIGEADLVEGKGSERPLYFTTVTGSEVLLNPFVDMVRSEPRARVAIGDGTDGKKGAKKVKRKGGKALLSFGDDEGDEAAEEPVLKKEKFNPKLVQANDTVDSSNGANIGVKAIGKKPEKAIRQRSSRSKSPRHFIKPNPETQLPLHDDEEPTRSSSSSPEPLNLGNVSTLLDKTNAQIADLKASMKRNIQTAPATETRKVSALEQMIPDTAMRGRKRKHGVNGDASGDKQTMEILNAFRAKLEKATPVAEASKSPAHHLEKQSSLNDSIDKDADDNDEEAALCDLHFIANCQSCRVWDQHASGDAEAKDDDNEGWMSHALSFEKDRLGKDLTWKRKNEEELVVIDPREKAKDIREERRAKKLGKSWDKDRDRGRAPAKRTWERG